MKTQIRKLGWGLLTVAVVSMIGAGSVFAEPGFSFSPRLRPLVRPPVTTPFTPRLGIMGHMRNGWGMVVDSVNPGTLAARLGLERGDMIIRINDRQVNSDRSYHESLWSAAQYLDGYVDLVIVDVRTGRARHRTGYLHTGSGYSGSGPIVPRSAPHLSFQIGTVHGRL